MATPIPTNQATFTVEEIVAATGATKVTGPSSGRFTGVTTDSRAVTVGSIFVALRGERFDGHAFAQAAFDKGAALLIVAAGSDVNVQAACIVEVADTLVAWGALARAHLERWRAAKPTRRVIAITGSAGKTTTKELACLLCSEVAPTHATLGNLNNRIGVPAVIFGLESGHEIAVLEMGMSLPGELDAITAFARPDIAIVTNVGIAHAEGVGGADGVMREKGAVYRALTREGVAIVNADDERATLAAEKTLGRIETFGTSERAAYRMVRREALGHVGARVTLGCKGRELEVRFSLPGEVAALDLAAALAAQEAATGEALSASRIEHALSSIRVEGRAETRVLPGDVLLLDDAYNANPASMHAALATLAEIAEERRRVVVLGEMKELGARAKEEHAALGEALAAAGVTLAIGCGGLIDATLRRAADEGVEVHRAKTTDEAAAVAARFMRPGDAILVKASRSVGAERVVAALVKASESLPSAPKSASSEAG